MGVRISILPKTLLGIWSLVLAIAFILFFVWYAVTTGGNRALTVIETIVFVGISGAAFVTGLVSMIKNRERSVLVFVGVVITFWVGLLGGVVGQFFI
jgi:hypothetical protein